MKAGFLIKQIKQRPGTRQSYQLLIIEVKKKVPEKRNAHLVCFSKSLNIHLPYMITNIIDI